MQRGLEKLAGQTVAESVESQTEAKAGNFTGLHVGDYIPFTAGGNNVKAEIADMDAYYNYGSTPIPHHIDFISRDCWPDAHAWNKKSYNNGTTVSPNPWLASDLYAFLNSLAMQVSNDTVANPALVAVDYSNGYDHYGRPFDALYVPVCFRIA